MLHLSIGAFEPVGEECGTEYDENTACLKCGAGRTQRGRLRLDLRKAPKSCPITCTIADEWIVRDDLVRLIRESGLNGAHFEEVQHKSRHADEPVDYFAVPTGRLIVELADRAGLKQSDRFSFDFCTFLNRPELRKLVKRADEEHARMLAERDARHPPKMHRWHQLLITAPRPRFHSRARFGDGVLEPDVEKRHICPYGHTKGLNIHSEVFVRKDDYFGADITCTAECVGVRRGVLVPSPLLLISQKFHQFLQEHKIKGYGVAVAHLV